MWETYVKMQNLQTAINMVQKDSYMVTWMATLDLSDAYYSVLVAEEDRNLGLGGRCLAI